MADVKIFKVTEPYLDHKCLLGEGPFFEKLNNTLRFGDIERCQLHTVNLGVGPSSHRIVTLDQPVSVTADIVGDNDHFMFLGKDSINIYNKSTQKYKVIHELWTAEEKANDVVKLHRGNDGKIDAQGRFWFGTMSDPLVRKEIKKDDGILFRLDPDGSLKRMLEPATIPNGISWTDDQKTMYWTDTGNASIYAFDFDTSTGNISNQRTFFKSDEGNPDGHAMDEEQHIWTALYGGGKVVRVNPQGKVVAEIHLPTSNPTCPVFAGEELYITTAIDENQKHSEESRKMSGMTFKCHVGIRGKPVHEFKYRQS